MILSQKKWIATSFACLMSGILISQGLPRGLSESERQLIAGEHFRPSTVIPGEFLPLQSPNAPMRAIAEWEEQQAIVITWAGYTSILKEIVRYAKEEVTVIIVTTNPDNVRTYLEDNGIDTSEGIEFIEEDYNTVWIRDYGANPTYLRDVDSLVLVDWIYNRPRPKDDVIPFAVASHLDVPIFSTSEAPLDLVNTGGNFMSDGLGRGFSSELVLTENGPNNNFGTSNHDEAAVDAIMQQFMGIEEYVKMPVLPYDGIHHIDMHMKMVDEGTLVVGEYPEGIADGPQIEANLQYVIENFKETTGRDYRVVRIPMPPDGSDRYPDQGGHYRTYANAMFVNKSILVPVYEEQYDTTALRIWRETMPGYNVVGINCNTIIPASGALHCIIKEVGIHRPLWVTHHQPGEIGVLDDRTLDAQIKHISGISAAYLFYRSSGTTTYDSVAMENSTEDIWTASLPEYDQDVVVEYYFKAVSNDGKRITRPLPAPEGFFAVNVEASEPSTTETLSSHIALDVFPNPASSITCIPVHMSQASTGSLRLVDIHGRCIKALQTGIFPDGESKYFFDAGQIPPGYYILYLTTEALRISVPVIIR